MVVGNRFHKTLVNEFSDGTSSQTSVDLQSLRNNGGSDELGSGDFLQELIVGGLIEDDQVGDLLSGLGLGPLLLLLLGRASDGLSLVLLLSGRTSNVQR